MSICAGIWSLTDGLQRHESQCRSSDHDIRRPTGSTGWRTSDDAWRAVEASANARSSTMARSGISACSSRTARSRRSQVWTDTPAASPRSTSRSVAATALLISPAKTLVTPATQSIPGTDVRLLCTRSSRASPKQCWAAQYLPKSPTEPVTHISV